MVFRRKMADIIGLEPMTNGLTVRDSTNWAIYQLHLVLITGIEPITSPLPKECSTFWTKPAKIFGSKSRIRTYSVLSNIRLTAECITVLRILELLLKSGWYSRTRTYDQRINSPRLYQLSYISITSGAENRNRTRNRRLTRALHYLLCYFSINTSVFHLAPRVGFEPTMSFRTSG